jgi:hypothetical protein
MELPKALSNKVISEILSRAIKMRNDFGHGGVVPQHEAKLRNELLLTEVQNLRGGIGNVWKDTHLIRALHCRPRRGVFENEIAILMGSNSEFLKESRSLTTWLDVERLYLSKRDSGAGLRLLPLIQIGPSPQSAKNACYFFSRLEKEGARFVSYHFSDQPERNEPFTEVKETINFLTQG